MTHVKFEIWIPVTKLVWFSACCRIATIWLRTKTHLLVVYNMYFLLRSTAHREDNIGRAITIYSHRSMSITCQPHAIHPSIPISAKLTGPAPVGNCNSSAILKPPSRWFNHSCSVWYPVFWHTNTTSTRYKSVSLSCRFVSRENLPPIQSPSRSTIAFEWGCAHVHWLLEAESNIPVAEDL